MSFQTFPNLNEAEGLQNAALNGDLEAFDQLIDNLFLGDPGASLHLLPILETKIWALHRVGYFVGDPVNGPLIHHLISQLQFHREDYQPAVDKNPQFYLPFLCNLAEFEHRNVRDLLGELLLRTSSDEVFFVFVGIAEQGSRWALRALNENGTEKQMELLARIAETYQSDPRLGEKILNFIRQPDFRPKCLIQKDARLAPSSCIQTFGKLGAPFAATFPAQEFRTIH